jgi:bacteriocin biosynthesis cyclodehydratase domain-containing protein
VVLARPWAASDPVAAAVHRSGVPHLVATVRGDTGVVGPFVVPGATSCLHCADLHRRDADPRWPALAAQLTATEAPPSGATVTCLLTAATAAAQVLAYLDGAAAPLTIDATLELRPPELVPRLRRWTAHSECSCGAPGSAARAASAAGRLPRVGTPTGETGPPQGTMGVRPSSGAHPDDTAEH